MSRLRENELFNHLNDKVRIGNMYILDTRVYLWTKGQLEVHFTLDLEWGWADRYPIL